MSDPSDLLYSADPSGRADPNEPTSPVDEARATGDVAAEPPAREVEGATPTGYDWPTHGGYLGCLVGTLAACPIVGFIGANLWALFRLTWLALPLFALLTLVSLAAVVAAGRLGWALGRRFYRYYAQPRPIWGESDAAMEPNVQPAALDVGADGAPSAADLPAEVELTPTEDGATA